MSNKLVCICGDSGSGKSELAKSINNLFSDLLYYECDRYHKWERVNENWNFYTHLNPLANNIDEMYNDILLLKQNKSIIVKDYDHFTGKFTEPCKVNPSEIIIVSGLHTLYNKEMSKLVYDLSIYIEPDENLRILWKFKRDVHERKYDIETIKNKILFRENDKKKYIEPQKNNADIIIKYMPYVPIDISSISDENILEFLNPEFYTEILIRNTIDKMTNIIEIVNKFINVTSGQRGNSPILEKDSDFIKLIYKNNNDSTDLINFIIQNIKL